MNLPLMNLSPPTLSHTQPATLVELLQQQARNQPDKMAYTFLADGETEEASLTYAQLDRQARAIAARLGEFASPSERALLLYPAGLSFIAAFFGCLYAGVIAVPTYPPRRNRPDPRFWAIADDAQATVVLTTMEQLARDAESKASVRLANLHWLATDKVVMDDGAKTLAEEDWQRPMMDGDTLAFLQYTSGSTGNPKGVMVSHGNLLHNEEMIKQGFGYKAIQAVGWLPLFHDMGLIGNVLQPLYLGIPCILFSPVAFLQKPFRWLQAISRYRATSSGGPNFAYDLCVEKISARQRAELDLSCWKLAFSGAEPVRAETMARFSEAFASCGFAREAFYPTYGMAETTLFVSGRRTGEPVIYQAEKDALEQHRAVPARSEKDARQLVGCGRTDWLDQRVVIVEPESCVACKDEQIGEIWVSGGHVAKGYWDRIEETSRTFRAYLADGKDQGNGKGPFLRTGDLGFLRAGELFVTGRLKDMIIIHGRNYYPQDLELVVENSHQALTPNGCAAFSVEQEGEERLVIVQEVARTWLHRLEPEVVFDAIRQAILEQHELVIHAIVLLKPGRLPKTSSGKVQRRRCRQSFLAGELEALAKWQRPMAGRDQTTEVAEDGIGEPEPRPHHEQQMDMAPPASIPLVEGDKGTEKAITDWLVNKIAGITGLAPKSIDTSRPFAYWGLDSVAATGLSGELGDWLGQALPPTLVYDYPSIDALARYLSTGRESGKGVDSTSIALSASTPNIPDRPTTTDAIAIIGLGCRFPKARNPEEFWRILKNGVDAIRQVPASRWTPTEKAVPWGGFIDEVDQFDPAFFGISPREAETMDPQQRLVLEVAWESLEHAGIAPDSLAGSRTGVFMGISTNDYARQLPAMGSNLYFETGNAFCIAANRLSYLWDLRGPSKAIDTACSSSLVSVHNACQNLRQGECDLALAGGVNLMLAPGITESFTTSQLLSSEGRCKTFDAAADGYVRGEGCGIVVLKRLTDAHRDGDSILAVIQGSAVNQDGRTNGITAPNGPAQQMVIREALANAGVEASAIGYVEAHGTGTPLGDPIEFNSLQAILAPHRAPEQICYIGSVKTNIGHLEAAAGIAGLIKTVLVLQHQKIPPHLHLKTLSPHLDIGDAPLAIPTEPIPWSAKAPNAQRLAGVSSFGFGGTNAHIVLGEAPSVPRTGMANTNKDDTIHSGPPLHLLTLSAQNETALQALAGAYANHFGSHPETSLADASFTANTGRTHFRHRIALIAQSTEQAREQLSTANYTVDKASRTKPEIAFLFTGQGSQYRQMGRQLFDTEPRFRETLNRCDAILRTLNVPLLELLYNKGVDDDSLNQTIHTQPALFALEYALARLWQSWGITPDVVMGHSVGEYAAACIAGVFGLEDGLKLIAARGRLMQTLCEPGDMLALPVTESDAQALIAPFAGQLSLAAINGPSSVVVSGAPAAIVRLTATLAGKEIKGSPLSVSHAFHSGLMEPMLAEFEKVANTISYGAPDIPLCSNVTGQMATEEVMTPGYWVRHARQPVRFLETIETLHKNGIDAFLEVGPQPILLGLARQCLPGSQDNLIRLPSLRRGNDEGRDDWRQMLQSLGEWYVKGGSVDWRAFHRTGLEAPRKISLPTYPFQRQRYWVEEKSHRRPAHDRHAHPLLGQRLQLAGREVHFESYLDLPSVSWLADHRVFDRAVFPATGFLEMVLAAGTDIGSGAGPQCWVSPPLVKDVLFDQALMLPEEETTTVQTVLSPTDRGYRFQISSLDESHWQPHITGQLLMDPVDASEKAPPEPLDLVAWQKKCPTSLSVADHYRRCRERGLNYGPDFQGVTQLFHGDGVALARITLPESLEGQTTRENDPYHLHPALFHAALQVMLSVAPNSSDTETYLPVAMEEFQHHCPMGTDFWSLARVIRTDEKHVTCEVSLFDESCHPIADIKGLTAGRVGIDTLARHFKKQSDELYEVSWQSREFQAEESMAREDAGDWLLFADQSGVGQALAAQLTASGNTCVLVYAGEAFQEKGNNTWHIDPAEPGDFHRLLNDAFPPERSLRGVIHLWALDAPDPLELTSDALLDAQVLGCGSVLHLLQAGLQQNRLTKLWLITRNAVSVGAPGPLAIAQAPLWGLGRAIALEHPNTQCALMDLGPGGEAEPETWKILKEITARSSEQQIAFRGNSRYVARLVRYRESASASTSKEGLKIPRAPSYQLQIPRRGALEDLLLAPTVRHRPKAGEIEIRVRACGLNFRDVLNALDLYPGDPGPLGGECAGEVVTIGKEVKGFRIGDGVLAIAPGSLGEYVTVDARLVIAKPKALDFEEAATIPVVFLAAYYCLYRIANISAGTRILIHTSTGGVGQAAVQLAQLAGAQVFATARSHKWELLRSMGVEHIIDSRTLDFADRIMEITQGQGVDIVLNSLTSEGFIEKSLSVLKSGGRFLEINNIDVWQPEQVAQFRPDIAYSLIDLLQICLAQPGSIQAMFRELMPLFETGTLKPLSRRVFSITKAVDAFRYVQKAKYIGKVIITPSANTAKTDTTSLFRADATYLITDDPGGPGLEIANRMVERGARHLVLTGRRRSSDEGRAALTRLEETGARVLVATADLCDWGKMLQLFQEIGVRMPPLKGVIHAAGLPDDGILPEQDMARFHAVMAPKLLGGWHLHTLTQPLSLDFFVCFSSASSLLGSKGQGNYAAANAFLDTLIHHRHALGLPGLSINWGTWTRMGPITDPSEPEGKRSAVSEMGAIDPERGFSHLERFMRQPDAVQLGIFPMNWPGFFRQFPVLPAFFSELAPRQPSSSAGNAIRVKQRLEQATEEKYGQILEDFIRSGVGDALRIPPSQLDTQRPLNTMGLDSLMAVEFRNRIRSELDVDIPLTELMGGVSVLDLIKKIETRYVEAFATSPLPTGTATSSQEQLLAKLESGQLTDEEIEALFDEYARHGAN
uniref:Acyl transferase domain-containing protein n=1 Tax=Candidatus Kentrum sp. MB TaxID=2138164 RepID=A0A450X368_9GAMM|nr:MAG: Acyl transferase domain-containing protein [Candidatus Kentron sp. MB]